MVPFGTPPTRLLNEKDVLISRATSTTSTVLNKVKYGGSRVSRNQARVCARVV